MAIIPKYTALLFWLSGTAALIPPQTVYNTKAFSRGSRCIISKLCATATEPYGRDNAFGEQFDRWKYLQDFLDGEIECDGTNRLLYRVLKEYFDNAKPEEEDDSETGSPKMTPKFKENLMHTLSLAQGDSLKVLGNSSNEALLKSLESLLPDPEEEEDAFKSLWDTLVEIHGREMVKIRETNPTPEWTCQCLVARILIWFDYLTFKTT